MDRLLAPTTLLDNRFRVADLLGHGAQNAAYLAADLDQGGAWTLVWESLNLFRMRQRPAGVVHYLAQGERHYLMLRLEGQDLGLVLTAAEAVEEGWAALWMMQVCDGIGQWHTRAEERLICLKSGDIRLADLKLTANGRAILPGCDLERLICLKSGDIRLADLKLTANGRAILPGCDLLSQPVQALVPGQSLAFSAPEKALGQPLTVRSDVYALGAALYCLVTGTPPPDPRAHQEGQAELVPPRRIRHQISGRLEKTILKAMSPDPALRHESAMQLSFELDRCVPRRLRHQIGAF